MNRPLHLWRQRAFAVGAALALHALFLAILAGDWAAHRAPPPRPPVIITLERAAPKPSAQREAKAAPSRISVRASAAPAASPIAPLPVEPVAAVPIRAPDALARVAPAPLRVGCLGQDRDRMTPAQRRACDEEQKRLVIAPSSRLPEKLPPTALDREFAAAYAKRRENRPSTRAPRSTDCPLENITACAPEDTTIKMVTSTGDGQLQKQMRRFIPPPPRDDRAPPLTGPIDGKAK